MFNIELSSRHGSEEAILSKVKHTNRKTKKVTFTFDLCLDWQEIKGKNETTILNKDISYSGDGAHLDL